MASAADVGQVVEFVASHSGSAFDVVDLLSVSGAAWVLVFTVALAAFL
jgi:hypothetical protein